MLKKVLTYLFAALFLFSVTGVSLQLHTCLSAGKTTYSFYPEFFGAKKSCCCNDVTVRESEETPGNQQFREIPCCSSDHILYKIPTFQNQRSGESLVIITMVTPGLVNICAPINKMPDTKAISVYRPPPLLLAGVSFIRYSHSFKIPLPVS